MIRKLQPKIILNDRLDLEDGWDIKTPEQYQPRGWVQVKGPPVVWEACQTFSGVLGLPPRRVHVEERGATGPDAARHGEQLLNDASEVPMKGLDAWQENADNRQGPETLALTLPVPRPNVTVPVIELFLK